MTAEVRTLHKIAGEIMQHKQMANYPLALQIAAQVQTTKSLNRLIRLQTDKK